MINDNKTLRMLVALLTVVGAILIYLAKAWLGYLLVVLGALVELISIRLSRK